MSMKKLILIVMFSAIGNSNALAQTAVDILKRSDEIRTPQNSFVVNVSLKQYQSGKLTAQTQVRTHSKKNANGQFSSIVHIDKPVNDQGKIMMRNDNVLWMYDPKSKASVRISPRQRLLGNVSTGDVITSNFYLDYKAELTGTENIQDGDKKNIETWKLKLKAKTAMATYHTVEVWIDKQYRPIKADFFSQSGKRLSVAWYRGWRNVMGMTRPTEIVVVNGVDSKKVTVVNMNNYRAVDLPTSWFNKDWLTNFQPK
jgi:outer membrane lipoprotein-sorting protein